MDSHRRTAVNEATSRPGSFAAVRSRWHPAERPQGRRPWTRHAFHAASQRILDSINTVIDGKSEAAKLALTVLLAQGHLLLEDVPGVGKTLLAKTLARTIDCTVSRIQFTPDLLPSDVTGVSIYNQSSRLFEFRPGAVFANIVIGDEINRASAKTQSALLECMEEHQVTVDGHSYKLDEPFMVVATQNPIEMEGTYPLPEAQRDRFMARISMGYPDKDSEIEMLETHQATSPLAKVSAVVTAADVAAMIATVQQVYVSQAVKEYTVSVGRATRESPLLRLGASPRSMLQLLRAAKATAALDGRDFVLPDDVVGVAESVLAHRIILDRKAASAGETPHSVIRGILSRLPVSQELVPQPGRRRRQRRAPAPGSAAEPLGRRPMALAGPTPPAPLQPARLGASRCRCGFPVGSADHGPAGPPEPQRPADRPSPGLPGRDQARQATIPGVPRVQSFPAWRPPPPRPSGWPWPGPARAPGGRSWRSSCPPRFGESPAFRFPARSATGGTSRYEYHLRSSKRGQFLIGPVTAEFTDPFGLSLHRQAIDDGDTLTVTPAAVELPVTGLAGARGNDGITATRIRANPSDDDVMTREYRHGDPMRRVHWAGHRPARRPDGPAGGIRDHAGGHHHPGPAVRGVCRADRAPRFRRDVRRGRPRDGHQRHVRVGGGGGHLHQRPPRRAELCPAPPGPRGANRLSCVPPPRRSRRPRSTAGAGGPAVHRREPGRHPALRAAPPCAGHHARCAGTTVGRLRSGRFR